MQMPSRNEVIIALIGLAGVVITALLSNWDKVSGQTNSGEEKVIYETSNNIDVQLRYFVEISGTRAALEVMQKTREEQLKWKYQATQEEINCMLDLDIQTSQLVDLMVSVMKRNLTLSEVKELNRTYSNPVMKTYLAKQPAITRDLLSELDALMERTQTRNNAIASSNKTKSAKEKKGESCPAP